MPEVKLVNITKRYNEITAIDHMNLHIHDGEYFTIIGPTSSGKTTTLMIIAGLIKPDGGEIYINGRLANDVPPEDRGVGFVFQKFELFPHMNVWDNVTYGPFVKGWDQNTAGKTAREMLELIYLAARSKAIPNELSGGMQQRVALARALTSGSKLLLLDEPLGALDAKIRYELRYELRRLVKDLKLTAVHVTHDFEEAMGVSDRIAVLRKGKILQVGTPSELYNHPANLFVANFVGETNFLEGVVKSVDKEGSTIEVKNGDALRVLDRRGNVGERVVVTIRSENINIEEGELKKTNGLFGRITRSKFISGYIRYEIRLNNQIQIVTRKLAREATHPQINDRVTISFEPDKVLIFPYPEEGLEKALSAE